MDTTLLPSKVETKNGKMRYQFPKKEALLSHTPEYQSYIDHAKKELEKNGLGFGSMMNMMIVLMQVRHRFPEQIGNAIPYLTIKTFNQWRHEGRLVKKGEKAMQCLTYVHAQIENKETHQKEDDLDTMFPKTAHVFGIWQTEKIEEKKNATDMSDVIYEDQCASSITY